MKEGENSQLLLSIGVILDENEPEKIRRQAEKLCRVLQQSLQKDLPDFLWQIKILIRHDFPTGMPRDPLALLEYGADIKIEQGFDYFLPLTSAPLVARFTQGANAVISAMLEVGVISIARQLALDEGPVREQAILGLTRHVLGHLFGLEHSDDSVMQPREFWNDQQPLDWSEQEKKEIADHLKTIADPRLEETAGAGKSLLKFSCQLLLRDGLSLMRDILLHRSWLMMLHLGRFIAATAVSIIFLFLSAEAWELGAAFQDDWLNVALVIVLLLATFSLYYGQNLQAVGRSDRIMEQVVRSRIILFGTLLVGMCSFWVNLFVISLGVIWIMPETVLAGWAGLDNQPLPIVHFARLMATFGILASAVGGNLEEEHDLKAVLIYSEET